ncbi:DUF192 domain-containing protein [Cohnella pontilimi]|uniref:DUF192 domain-containing protein n=1 Tax=Cohnella pontilimi TaxID=2564100 RepID=A0A4U0FBX8_9BACL|nr:DUF192 domain-containing protein [Cohnella pontilimi]TJY40722.1 DUF192 domain-containing protein [Cohnella pontilimi]
MRLVIRESGRQLADRIELADTFFRRFRGLMLTKSLPKGTGLHIRPCRSVHSFFMKYSIDVLHLDEFGRIVGMEPRLRPGRIGQSFQGTHSIIELPAGSLEEADVRVGQTADIIASKQTTILEPKSRRKKT